MIDLGLIIQFWYKAVSKDGKEEIKTSAFGFSDSPKNEKSYFKMSDAFEIINNHFINKMIYTMTFLEAYSSGYDSISFLPKIRVKQLGTEDKFIVCSDWKVENVLVESENEQL